MSPAPLFLPQYYFRHDNLIVYEAQQSANAMGYLTATPDPSTPAQVDGLGKGGHLKSISSLLYIFAHVQVPQNCGREWQELGCSSLDCASPKILSA